MLISFICIVLVVFLLHRGAWLKRRRQHTYIMIRLLKDPFAKSSLVLNFFSDPYYKNMGWGGVWGVRGGVPGVGQKVPKKDS